MKRFLSVIVVSSLLFLSLPALTIKAVTLTPSSGTYNPSVTINIAVTAAPNGANQNAVAIRMSVTNMTVLGFTPVTGGSWVGSTGDCGSGAYYTSTTVCASLAKSVDIVAGETLGTMTVQMGTPGTATVTKTSGNAYSDGSTSTPDTGLAATFTITNNALPNTGIEDYQGVFVILSGVIFLVIGFSLLKNKHTNTYETTA